MTSPSTAQPPSRLSRIPSGKAHAARVSPPSNHSHGGWSPGCLRQSALRTCRLRCSGCRAHMLLRSCPSGKDLPRNTRSCVRTTGCGAGSSPATGSRRPRTPAPRCPSPSSLIQQDQHPTTMLSQFLRGNRFRNMYGRCPPW